MPHRPVEPLEPRRLFAAYGLDPSFNGTGVATVEVPVPTAPNPAEALVQDDGKYLVAALWDHHTVMRFNADGSVDRGFGEGGGVSRRALGMVSEIALQPGGRIIVAAGDDPTLDGYVLRRLNPDGSVDPAFGGGAGLVHVNWPGVGTSGSAVSDIAVDSQGRIAVHGTGNNLADVYVARYTADGLPDASFSGDGFAPLEMPGQQYAGLLLAQPDGKLVISLASTTSAPRILRLNAEGSVDGTFGEFSGFTEMRSGFNGIRAMAFDAAGRILIASEADGFQGSGHTLVARYTANGHADTSFGVGGVAQPFYLLRRFADSSPTSLAVDGAGRILVGGVSDGSTRVFTIARVKADGSGLDATFDNDGLVYPALAAPGGTPVSVFATAEGVVTAVGASGPGDVTLVRVTPAGAPDPGFGGGDGIATRRGYLRDDDAPTTLVRQDDGKLLVLSSWADYTGSYQYYSALTRLLPDGTPDTAFGDYGTVPLSGVAHDVAAGPGRIVVTTHTGVYSLTAAGAPDPAFGGGDGLVEQPFGTSGSSVGIDSLGRVYLRRSGTLTRLERDGTADEAFAGDGTLELQPTSHAQLGDVFVAADDRVYVHVRDAERLFRVNPDGTQDMTYGGTGHVEVGHKATLGPRPDGSFFVGRTAGTGVLYEWQVEVRRLRADGTFDPAYGDGGVARADVYPRSFVDEVAGLAALPDGSVFASIGLPPYGSGSYPGSAVIKLTPQGQLDPQFDGDGQYFMPAASFPLFDKGLVVDDAARPVLLGRVQALETTRYYHWDTAVARLAPTGRPPTSVVGRHVFYNGSGFDGRSLAADARDDNAVATDKRALLPGQTATFDNVTSYRRGVNGVMIDLEDLPPNAVLTGNDFELQMGTEGDPVGWGFFWGVLPVSVRRGAGVGGSNRVTITLPDEWAVRNGWLRVKVKSQFASTGLAADDVFYFGNLVGETGTAAGPWRVDYADVARTRMALGATAAPVTSRYDFNRDGRVNVLDWAVVRQSQRQTLAAITPPAAGSAAPAVPSASEARALLSEESEAEVLE